MVSVIFFVHTYIKFRSGVRWSGDNFLLSVLVVEAAAAPDSDSDEDDSDSWRTVAYIMIVFFVICLIVFLLFLLLGK